MTALATIARPIGIRRSGTDGSTVGHGRARARGHCPHVFGVQLIPRFHAGWRQLPHPSSARNPTRPAILASAEVRVCPAGVSVERSLDMSNRCGAAEYVRAVIWVASDPEWQRYTSWCIDYCKRVGYHLVAVVEERCGGRYVDVERMVFKDERAEVIVVAQRDQLPPERCPRIEVVTEQRRRLGEESGPAQPERPQFLRR